MPITPTPFGTPGGAKDTPDFLTSASAASGPQGVAEELDKLGNDVAGIENRVVAGEAVVATIVSADALGTANNPVQSASATRPTGLAVVYWYTATQPTNWISGDVWDSTTDTGGATSTAWLLSNVDDVAFTGSIAYNAAGQITSATVAWADGTAGTYTATTDTTGTLVVAQTWTYGSRTVTQPTMTYNTSNQLTAQPARTVA